MLRRIVCAEWPEDRLVGLQDCTTKCDLLVEEGLVLLVENQRVRVLTVSGRPLGVALTKATIRRAGIEDGVLVVETRTHRGRFSSLSVWHARNPACHPGQCP
ncbi:hypothetical protein [Mesobacterium pallidum]|uniref:hypothetical protein n=1 Tax=Mesobacterium pallidum TaxID=2872037 RepID=UPI001EE1F321|nr:hypothetical protein [Mesobacterium pallidum]